MRLGDLDELKKYKFTTQIANGVEIEDIEVVPVAAIDNAQTVESEILIKPIAEIKCEITEEEKQRIIELLRKENPKLVKLEPERPQGEWGKHGECPFCSYIRQWEDDKFCGNCGADMRKPNYLKEQLDGNPDRFDRKEEE